MLKKPRSWKEEGPGFRVGDPVVTDIVALQYTRQCVILYKLDFSDNWQLLPQRLSVFSEQRMRLFVLPQLYCEPLKIKVEKFSHLQQFKSVLPKDHHAFYDHLPHICTDKDYPCLHVLNS